MDHLAEDLTVALEESESCGPIAFDSGSKWGMRRRTRSAGNLCAYLNKISGDNHSEESCSSSNSETRKSGKTTRYASFHQSDSDDLSLSLVSRVINNRTSLRMKNSLHTFLRGKYSKVGVSHSLESDSFNEHSPARPNLRRKRKFKRMSIDETPIPPSGKRKRSQRLEMMETGRVLRHTTKVKPLHPSIVDKIEKFYPKTTAPLIDESNMMETQSDENPYEIEVASESSVSWSGGEGHEGDDELTDWAPSLDTSLNMEQSIGEQDPREIRAGCRRLGDERPGFSISTGANDRIAKFLQDPTKSELRLHGPEIEKLGQLAQLYFLDLWTDPDGSSTILKKTIRTPCMQPTQRHHGGLVAPHKRIRTHRDHVRKK